MTRCHLLLALACAAAVACSGRSRAEGDAPSAGAIVLRGADLPSTSLLDAMRGRVSAMTVSTPSGECPRIVFRGRRSVNNQENPSVYVDGTRMVDTCILSQIATREIDYVEIYPGGSSSRADIPRNAFGVIIIYRHRR
jgi:hypothetical protein